MRLFTCALCCLLAVVVLAAAIPAQAEFKPACRTAQSKAEAGASGEPLPSLQLTATRYEVDVLGAVAVGYLVQELTSPQVDTVVVCEAPSGLRFTSMQIDIDGEQQEIEPEAKPTPRGSKPARKAATKSPRAFKLTSRPLELGVGQALTVRAAFQMPLPTSDGLIRMKLPGLGDRASALDASGRIAIQIQHDEPLMQADSPSHEIFVNYQGDSTLVEADEVLDGRDFELEFALGTDDEPTLLSYVGIQDEDGKRDMLVVVTPPLAPSDETVRPKQVLFVLDTSGSMAKGKLDQAREAIYASLEKLTDKDSFNLVEFNAQFRMMQPEPVPAGEFLQQGHGWLSALRPGGATKLLPALGATLEQPEDGERHRMIVLLTDGALQDEQGALEVLQQKLGNGRLFVVGIGDDVRQETIRRLAEYGRGTAAFASDPDGLDLALGGLFDSVSKPIAWDLELDFGGADVEVVSPRRLPDLYAGRPVTVHVKVRGEVPGEVRLAGQTMTGTRDWIKEIPADVVELERLPVSRSSKKR